MTPEQSNTTVNTSSKSFTGDMVQGLVFSLSLFTTSALIGAGLRYGNDLVVRYNERKHG